MGLADPFDLVGDDDVGAVCVHGFTGTPYEMRYLGEQLARAGISVKGLLLPGHGTSVAELDRARWEDWVESVERAVDAMRVRCRQVALVGQSLGGLLALYVASRRRDVTCVASLAAPLWLGGISGRVARWVTKGPLARLGALPKLGGSDVRDRRVRAENPCNPAFPIRALGELLEFMPLVDAALPAVTQPVLVLHAQHDHTAPVACAYRIAERTQAARLRILPRSFHMIAVDVERDIVAAEVITFVRHHARLVASGELSCAT